MRGIACLFVASMWLGCATVSLPPGADPITRRLADAVKQRAPDAVLSMPDRDTLVIETAATGKQQVAVENLRARCAETPDQCAEDIRRFADMATRAPPASTKAQLRPVLRHVGLLDEVKRHGMTVVSKPWVGELVRVFVFDSPESVAYATPQTLAEAGVTDAQLDAVADANARASYGRVEVAVAEGVGVAFLTALPDDTPGLLLFPEKFLTKLPFRVELACAVSRDALAVADGAHPREFRDLCRKAHRDAAKPVSAQVLRRSGDTWVVEAP